MSNKEIIFNLVSKYFSLEKDGLKKFEKNLYEPNIDEVYKELLKDSKDYRIKLPVPDEVLSDADQGWRDFKYQFNSFVNNYSVRYENFRKNKIKINKQEVKIFKALCDYYKDSMEKCRIERLLEVIGTKKYPKKQTSLVLSLNFEDWFLCAAAESWSSCLNVDSDYEGAYWAGLPGLVGDKNRAMMYLTNGQEKNYKNIVVDKVLTRSWLLLNKEDMINIVKFYPADLLYESTINEIFNVEKFKDLGSNYTSKHKVDFLFHTNGYSSFIYQDKTEFFKGGWLKYGDCGIYFYDKNSMHRSSNDVFYCGGGLSELASENINIFENTNKEVCPQCGRRDYDRVEVDEAFFCENCMNDYTMECIECGEVHLNAYSWNSVDSGQVCENCFEKFYIQCEKCNDSVHKDNVVFVSGGALCEGCFENARDNEKVYECSECELWCYIENGFVQNYDKKTCKPCYRKLMDKYQLKFDFAA